MTTAALFAHDVTVAKRPRTDRRRSERALRKQVGARERLAAAAPGGARDRPIAVASASVIDGKARSTPCVQCGGELDVLGDAAPPDGGGTLRVVRLVCRRCHAPRQMWFRIEASRMLPS
jgi:hypothetical protein